MAIQVYICNFVLLAWYTVAWGLFLAIIVPPESVTTVVGFFLALFGVLFGANLAFSFNDLYNSPAMSVFASFVAPMRFFSEGIIVSESRCLAQQTGYTVTDEAFNFPQFKGSYTSSINHM